MSVLAIVKCDCCGKEERVSLQRGRRSSYPETFPVRINMYLTDEGYDFEFDHTCLSCRKALLASLELAVKVIRKEK